MTEGGMMSPTTAAARSHTLQQKIRVCKLRKLSQYNVYATSWMVCSSTPCREKRFFCSPKHPNQLWDTPSLLFGRYWG